MPDLSDSQLVLKTIREVVGHAGMQDLFDARNGTEIYVPRYAGEDHWLTRLYGAEKAEEICSRLRITNADGVIVGRAKAYVSNRKTKFDLFRQALAEEITKALLTGKSPRLVALEVGVSERSVHREAASLIAIGRLKKPTHLKRLPSAKPVCAHNPAIRAAQPDWDVKAALVDEALLNAVPTGRISVSIVVSRGYVRIRRKMLEAAGKLTPASHAVKSPSLRPLASSEAYCQPSEIVDNMSDDTARSCDLDRSRPDEVRS